MRCLPLTMAPAYMFPSLGREGSEGLADLYILNLNLSPESDSEAMKGALTDHLRGVTQDPTTLDYNHDTRVDSADVMVPVEQTR